MAINWTKTSWGLDGERFHIARDKNRHYRLFDGTDGVGPKSTTLKACKELAEKILEGEATDAAYDKACPCMSEIEAAYQPTAEEIKEMQEAYDHIPTPEEEAELASRTHSIKIDNTWNETKPHVNPYDSGEECQPPTGYYPVYVPSVERNTSRDPIEVFSPCGCDHSIFKVTGRRTKQRERPRYHSCKTCGQKFKIDASKVPPTVTAL